MKLSVQIAPRLALHFEILSIEQTKAVIEEVSMHNIAVGGSRVKALQGTIFPFFLNIPLTSYGMTHFVNLQLPAARLEGVPCWLR